MRLARIGQFYSQNGVKAVFNTQLNEALIESCAGEAYAMAVSDGHAQAQYWMAARYYAGAPEPVSI